MCEAMVPRRRQGSGWLSAGVTGVQELILTAVTERWQMRGQRRAADLVFGGSMNSVDTLSMRCSGTCPLCVFTDRETQPWCWRTLKRRRRTWQSPCRGCQRGPKVRGNNQRERSHGDMLQNIPTLSKKTKQVWATGCFWVEWLQILLIFL